MMRLPNVILASFAMLLACNLILGMCPTRSFAQELGEPNNDLSIMAIDAPISVVPNNLPPFPPQIDLPVTLVPSPPPNFSGRSTQGSLSQSQAHAELAMQYMRQHQVVNAFKELKLAVALNKWKPTDLPNAAQSHCMMGDILLEYAFKAKSNGEGTKGMQRLLNAWWEYRQSLFLNPQDPATKSGMLKASQAAVEIRGTFNNILSLGSAFLLNGDQASALNCYKQCASMIQSGSTNADPQLAAAISEQIANITGKSPSTETTLPRPASLPQPSLMPEKAIESTYAQHAYSRSRQGESTSTVPDQDSPGKSPAARSFYVDDYIENVRRSLAREWRLSHIQTKSFPTIAFAVDKHGNISQLRIVKSSSDVGTDELALNAARRVAPFPDPPPGIGEITQTFNDKKDPVDLADYMRQLRRKIRHNWHPPHDLQEDHIIVAFKLNRDGSVGQLNITQPSASDARNKSSLDAISNAAPFQHLPEDAPDSVDIQFHFDHDIEEQESK